MTSGETVMRSGEKPRYPPIHHNWYVFFRALFGLGFRTLSKWHVERLENLPRKGRLIVVINHLSYLDTAAIFVALPRHLHHLGAEKYEFHPIFGPLMRVAGAIFIQRGEVDREAMRQAMNVLEDDNCLAMAIEGTRSKTGGLQPGKTGIAYFAARTNSPLIPIALWGTDKVVPALKRWRRADVHIRVGEPFRLPEGRARSEDLDRYTEDIMLRLARLLPEEYRGVYRDHPTLTSPAIRSEDEETVE